MKPIHSSRRQFLGGALAATLAASLLRDARAARGASGPYLDVHTHLGTTWNGDPPLTAEALLRWSLERVLTAFPKVNFIGHGPGFWASISGDMKAKDLGGYPTGPVAPGGALDRLFEAHKNLWGDLSASSGANAIGRDHDFGHSFLLRRADRLLFGTDYLKPGQPVPQFELLASLNLPAEVEAKIYRENAMRLLKVQRLR
jgi:predicted TIM-barrel fold metal-dependent hydrolase